MEILSVVRVTPNCVESAPLIIGIIVALGMLIINFYAFCIEKCEINYATIGTLCLAAALIIAYIILGLMQTSPIEAKIKIKNISVQEYQTMVEELETYTLDGDILTIRMSEQDFYRWYYRTHESTISVLSNTLLER